MAMASVPDVLDDYWLDDLTADLLDDYVDVGGMPFTPTAMQAAEAPNMRELSSQTNSHADDSSSVEESGHLKARKADTAHAKAQEAHHDSTAEAAQKSFSVNKATREKLRRERLNERFAELGQLLNLKGANVDKLRVLSEAIHVLKSLREEMTQLKDTNHRLHLANTMTSEMAVSLLKVQRDGDKTTVKRSADELAQEGESFQEPEKTPPFQPNETFSMKDRERLAQQMMKAQQLQTEVHKRKRLVMEGDTSPGFQHIHPNKLANMSSYGWPVNNGFPGNMTMNMWMPASAQDISQDHLLRPPVA